MGDSRTADLPHQLILFRLARRQGSAAAHAVGANELNLPHSTVTHSLDQSLPRGGMAAHQPAAYFQILLIGNFAEPKHPLQPGGIGRERLLHEDIHSLPQGVVQVSSTNVGVRGQQRHVARPQAIDRLGEDLRVEARAEDGLVEAFVVEGAPGFTLAVQWHPEWRVMEHPESLAMFRAFGEACTAYRDRNRQVAEGRS